MTLQDFKLFNVVIGVLLGATLVLVVLSCFLASPVFPWMALGFGTATLIAGIWRYFRL